MSLQGGDALTLVDILDQVSGSMRLEVSYSIPPCRLSKHQICPVISEGGAVAYFEEFVAYE